MNISTSLNIFHIDDPIAKAIERCKKAGFEALDMNYWDYQPMMQRWTEREEAAWAREAAEAARENGIPFTQMHGPVYGSSFARPVEGLDEEAFLALAGRSLRTAAVLGVPWVVFHPTNLTEDGNESIRETVEYNCRFYAKLLPIMEETGVGIALENMFDPARQANRRRRRGFGAVPEELAELIDGLGHPLFGACWDTGHAHVQGLSQSDSIRMLGSRLKSLHIQDNNGLSDQHLLPFYGSIRWDEVMAALQDIQYGGDFTYEAHMSVRVLPDELKDTSLAHAANVARYLRSL